MPESAESIFDDACGELAVGNLDAAISKYRESVELDPGYFDGWHSLGMALMKQGMLQEAIGAGLMATELRPNDLLAWTALSQMYVKDGKIAEAEAAKANATVLSIGGKIKKE